MTCGTKIIVAFLSLLPLVTKAQVVTKGTIYFERKTNLYKKISDERFRKMIPEEDKIKIDTFSLAFNDSISYFSYVQPLQGDKMPWLTQKNSVYQNQSSGQRKVFIDLWGTAIIINDTVMKRDWKITDKTRKIAGYECTRAIWHKDDSTKIYAWYTTDIVAPSGPESINGLPGTVLGLATEDGGVVFFAKRIDVTSPKEEALSPPKMKGDEYTEEQFLEEIRKKMEGKPFYNQVRRDLFFW